MNNNQVALIDLEQAISKAQETYQQRQTDWQNTLNLAIYHLAAANNDESITLYQNTISQNIPVYFIHDAIQDLIEYLQLFPSHSLAQEMQQQLHNHLVSRIS
jgi:hypothetical protein